MTNAELWSINTHERLYNKMGRRPQRCKEYLTPECDKIKNISFNRNIPTIYDFDKVIVEQFYSIK